MPDSATTERTLTNATPPLSRPLGVSVVSLCAGLVGVNGLLLILTQHSDNLPLGAIMLVVIYLSVARALWMGRTWALGGGVLLLAINLAHATQGVLTATVPGVFMVSLVFNALALIYLLASPRVRRYLGVSSLPAWQRIREILLFFVPGT